MPVKTPFTIEFETTGMQAVEHRLLGIADRAVAGQPVLHAIADMLRQMEVERFDEEGPGWAPLAQSTVDYKANRDLDPRILHATLALRESLTGEGTGEADIELVTPDELVFGSNVEYAIFHQEGTSRMPPRPPLELNKGQRQEITREVQRYLVGEEAQAIATERAAGNVF